jgi:short-subunit dehydrogenase
VAFVAQGTLSDQRGCEADVEALRQELITNFVAPASIISHVANEFALRGAGTIVVTSSVAGDVARGSNYVYGSAKGALSSFARGLRGRFDRTRIRIVTVKPGPIDTPMTRHLRKGLLWSTPERIAPSIVAAMDRGARVVYVPGYWRLVTLVLRHLPERVLSRLKL